MQINVVGTMEICLQPTAKAPEASLVQINVVGTMEICRSAGAHMVSSGGGSIINISALSATTLMADLFRYTSTKGAMESMSKTMAKEVGPSAVRVNIVTPGPTTGEPLNSMFERMAVVQNRTITTTSPEG